MATHGDTAIGSLPDSLRTIFDRPLVGATGTNREGEFGPGDAGDIQFALGVRGGRVVMDFGAAVWWMSMNPEQAAQVAQLIMLAANQAKAQSQLGTQ